MELLTHAVLLTAVDLSSGLAGHDGKLFWDNREKILNQTESGEESSVQLEIAKGHNESVSPASGEGDCHMLGEFAEWEIPWEDLQVGERIGIG